jgi:hypothetical protein
MTNVKEIAREIVKQIKHADPDADVTEAHVLDTINRWINRWRRRDLDSGLRKQNKKYAEEVIEWIKMGERLLIPRRDTVRPDYFFLDWDARRSAVVRMQSLEIIFGYMRGQAEWIIKQRVGEHGNAGQAQLVAAEVALSLMEQHDLPLTYSSETSVYRTVARLIFEAMTGRVSKNGADIARACKYKVLEHNEELAADAEDELEWEALGELDD